MKTKMTSEIVLLIRKEAFYGEKNGDSSNSPRTEKRKAQDGLRKIRISTYVGSGEKWSQILSALRALGI
jgi:hypothetical protein